MIIKMEGIFYRIRKYWEQGSHHLRILPVVLSKRQRLVLASSWVTLLLAILAVLEGRLAILGIVFSSLAAGLTTAILFGWRRTWLNVSHIVFVLLFTASFGFLQRLFPDTRLWFRISFLCYFGVIFYLILLAVNIFRVSEIRGNIPLLRPAKTTLFLVAVLISFQSFSVIFKGVPSAILQLVLVFALAFLLSAALFVNFKGSLNGLIGASLLASFLTLEALVALSFFPLKSFFRALMLTANCYTFFSLAREYFAHRLNGRIVLEYFLLLFALGAMIFWIGPR